MNEQVADRVTAAVATGAAMNPVWFPYLEQALSLSLSVLGVVWLLVQIFFKFKNGK